MCQGSDFSKEDIFNNSKWTISTWGNANRTHSVDNLWVKDVNALHAEVTARGAPIAVPIGTRPYGIRDFSVRDPNGVMVVFGQDWEE